MKTLEEQVKNADIEKAKFDLEIYEKRKNLELIRDKKKWTHRRTMAYVSFIFMIIMTSYIFYKMPVERITALSGMIEWMYLLFASIPLTYLGIATYAEIKNGNK